MTRISRRDFLNNSAALTVGAAALTAAETGRAKGANDRIVLALIGAGGRGSGVIRDMATKDNIHVAYICDVDPRRGNDLVTHFEKTQGKAPKKEQDLRRVLDDKNVDAVVVATPDHWHALATVLACQAGKDVYVEKPPSHNIWEGRKMVEAARKYNRIVQVGTQNRSGPYVHKAVEYIKSGKLGKIHLCKVFNLKSGGGFRLPRDSQAPDGVDYDRWLGPAPNRLFNAAHFHGGWGHFWAYSGGDMANDGIHQLDLARFLIGKDWPKSVVATGGKLAFPDDREVPDTQIVSYDFDDLVMTFELTQWAPYMDKIAVDVRNGDLFPYWPQCATRIEIYGTKGLMFMGRHGGGWQVFTRPKKQSRPGELVAQEFGRPGDDPHERNFFECIRSRKLPNADIEEGHRSACLVHLGNIALRVGGRKLVFDPKTESFVGDREANDLVKREYRKPYEIPAQV